MFEFPRKYGSIDALFQTVLAIKQQQHKVLNYRGSMLGRCGATWTTPEVVVQTPSAKRSMCIAAISSSPPQHRAALAMTGADEAIVQCASVVANTHGLLGSHRPHPRLVSRTYG